MPGSGAYGQVERLIQLLQGLSGIGKNKIQVHRFKTCFQCFVNGLTGLSRCIGTSQQIQVFLVKILDAQAQEVAAYVLEGADGFRVISSGLVSMATFSIVNTPRSLSTTWRSRSFNRVGVPPPI